MCLPKTMTISCSLEEISLEHPSASLTLLQSISLPAGHFTGRESESWTHSSTEKLGDSRIGALS